MIHSLLDPEVQKFIFSHEQDDEKALVLKHKTILGLPASLAAEQISSRRKAKVKIPTYYNSPGIIYPPGLNLEQSSSEKTAQFKIEILSTLPSHETLADVTGGLGIDTFFFSKRFRVVHHIEPNESLQEIARHNHSKLGATHITYFSGTARDFLLQSSSLNCVFIDPSRRASGQKVFRLEDCEPNIVELLPTLFNLTDYVLLKTSPLLDIQLGVDSLKDVEKVWIVAVDNECKEILFLCNKNFTGEPEINTINLQESRESFAFLKSDEKQVDVEYSEPLNYLYEPNAAILKAGAFKLIGKRFSLAKLHSSTHLYTSSSLVESFPGRIFKIMQQVKPDTKALKEFFPEGKANIVTRNYPLTVDELKKKTKLKDGGEKYLIGFTGPQKKYLVAADRVK